MRAILILTGFSSFPGVPANPTEVLADWVKEHYCPQNGCADKGSLVDVCCVLRVAAKDVDQWLLTTAKELETTALGAPVLFVHLGVDMTRKTFNIESRAYNDADFRVPDEDGWCPDHCQIDTNEPIDSYLSTSLDISGLHSSLRSEGFDVNLSQDAGRYICNWTYYKSLLASQEHRTGGWQSLFIHVPSFSAIDEHTQKRFVGSVLEKLCQAPTELPAEEMPQEKVSTPVQKRRMCQVQ